MPHAVPYHGKKLTGKKEAGQLTNFMVSFELFYLQSISL